MMPGWHTGGDCLSVSQRRCVVSCLLLCVCLCLCCREEGMAGLWKGLGPNIARNAIINAAELASYDQIKVSLLATGEASECVDRQGKGNRPCVCVVSGVGGKQGGREGGRGMPACATGACKPQPVADTSVTD